MNFNCCLDPVIYFFAIKTYKKRVMSLFKDYLYTSGASSKMTAENSSSNTWETTADSARCTYRSYATDLFSHAKLKKKEKEKGFILRSLFCWCGFSNPFHLKYISIMYGHMQCMCLNLAVKKQN